MGQVGGYVTILVGLFCVLGAFGAYAEASDLQARHDTYCGGIMEALLDWDGNCEEMREYISTLEGIALVLGIVGILLLISGNNEASKDKETKPPKDNGVKLIHYSSGKTIVKPFSVLESLQSPPLPNNDFCSNCGTPFPFNSANNFCTNCGNSL